MTRYSRAANCIMSGAIRTAPALLGFTSFLAEQARIANFQLGVLKELAEIFQLVTFFAEHARGTE